MNHRRYRVFPATPMCMGEVTAILLFIMADGARADAMIDPPSSLTRDEEGSTARRRYKNLILGIRSRLELDPLQPLFANERTSCLGIAAVEIPIGVVDDLPLRGALDAVVGLAGVMKIGGISGMTYGVYRHHGPNEAGEQEGHVLMLGAGVAVTPWEDLPTAPLLSLQLSVSHETYFQDRLQGRSVQETGGQGFYLHPIVVWGPDENLHLYAMVTLPVTQTFSDPSERYPWRAGFGFFWTFGGYEG